MASSYTLLLSVNFSTFNYPLPVKKFSSFYLLNYGSIVKVFRINHLKKFPSRKTPGLGHVSPAADSL